MSSRRQEDAASGQRSPSRLAGFVQQLKDYWKDRQSHRQAYRMLKKSGFFDAEFYLDEYPDVGLDRQDPVSHFIRCGASEGRRPNSFFNTAAYLDDFPESVLDGANPLLHFMERNPTASDCRYPPSEPQPWNPSVDEIREAFDTFAKASLRGFFASEQHLVFPATREPEVSILIALYNRCELTYLCLQSLLASCQRPYEIILVDNASSDNTRKLLERCRNVKVIRNTANEGFVRAVNQAAALATGKHLLLLNNDTQLLGDPIGTALDILDADEQVGAVGARVLLPDSTLQEAGCMLTRKGRASGYGRGLAPDNYQFMFRRNVDFCSGVFLMTPRKCFEEIGGLDERYSPAYCEEVDYCIQLAQRGKRVVYEPSATLLHYEFASSSGREAAIALQQKNRKQLYRKHKQWFETRQQHAQEVPLFMRSTPGPLRVLLIDDRVPADVEGAGAPRAKELVRAMLRLGAFVTMLPIVQPEGDWSEIRRSLPPEVEVALHVGRGLLRRFLTQRKGYYDVIFVSRPHNMQAVQRAIDDDPSVTGGAKLVYDAEAVFAMREISRRKLLGEELSPAQQQQMVDEECSLARSAAVVVTVSASEGAHLRRDNQQLATLGHAVTPQLAPQGFEERSGVLFVGAASDGASPNADSLRWFAEDVLPHLRQLEHAPQQVKICGKCEESLARDLASHQLAVMGQVDDLTPHYAAARVFMAPTRFAAGIPLKIIEAAAYGLPVVATSILAEQLGWQHERELLVADDPAGFAAALIRLHQDAALWNQLRQRALKAIEKDFSPERFEQTVAEILAARQ